MDLLDKCLQKLDGVARSAYVGGYGPPGSGEGQLGFASGILLDGQGNLVVVDSGTPYGPGFLEPSIEAYKIGLSTTP